MEDTLVEDLFGYLPDEILGSIVSFLPNESALETSLISTRWRDLWSQVLIMHGTRDDFTGAVAGFLANFEDLDPLKHPRKLQFYYDEDSVLFATIATNSKLLLDFSSADSDELGGHYELKFILNNKQQHMIAYQDFPSTFLVKTLYLKSVRCLTTEAVSSIVSNLDHLENLVIAECSGLQSLLIESESKLHKLTILDCLQLKYLHLRTSKLKYFRYRGTLPRIWPESHFNLIDARLDFRLGPSSSDFKVQNFDETLLTVKNSKVLTLCEWTFEELIWPSISPSSGSFIFYTLRELCWIHSHIDENSIDALICFLKLCPALEELSVMIDPNSYSAPRSNSCLMQPIKYAHMQNLKVIKFIEFTSQVQEISVAKRVIELVKGRIPKIEASDGSFLDLGFVW